MEGMAFVDEKGRVLFSPAGCGEDEGYTIIQLAESGYTDLLEEIAERFANYEQRLKAYEDIGLTPEQLTEVDRLYAEKCREMAESEKRNFSGLEMVKIWAKLKKLKEYQNLEKQGKLLKLPAAIGDEIFFIFMDCPKDYKKEYCRDHEGSCENCHHRVPEIVSRDFRIFDIPIMDRIFATREEAEAALKEL